MDARNRGELGWGLLLLAAGVIILLANFGMLPWSGVLWGRWWPLILIAIGVLLLVNRRDEGSRQASPPTGDTASASPSAAPPVQKPRAFPTVAVILIGIGVAFLAQDIIGGSSFPALVLIAIGIALLLRERWGR